MSVKRIAAFIIDMITTGCCFVVILVGFIALTRHSISADEVRFIMFMMHLFFVMRDALHCSVGKHLLKLEIVDLLGEKADWRACVLRNLFLLICPIEGIVLLATDRRIGDYVAKTNVITIAKK